MVWLLLLHLPAVPAHDGIPQHLAEVLVLPAHLLPRPELVELVVHQSDTTRFQCTMAQNMDRVSANAATFSLSQLSGKALLLMVMRVAFSNTCLQPLLATMEGLGDVDGLEVGLNEGG